MISLKNLFPLCAALRAGQYAIRALLGNICERKQIPPSLGERAGPRASGGGHARPGNRAVAPAGAAAAARAGSAGARRCSPSLAYR